MESGPDPKPPIVWPRRTGLADYRRAATPAEIHAIALGLEATWQHDPWMLDGVGLHVPPGPAWGPWYPGAAAPGWFRVLSGAGEPLRWVRRRSAPGPEAPTAGLLWLRAQVLGQPCLVAPEGVGGPGFLAAPGDLDTLGSPASIRRRVGAMDRQGWRALPRVELRDAGAIAEALGGLFMPGDLRLDWAMGLYLERGAGAGMAMLRRCTGPAGGG
ncbi:MAG TPA: hypothetical protein VK188_12275 [Holophaga sp.]|nr:hypothetical protein [Holophaga sp.]